MCLVYPVSNDHSKAFDTIDHSNPLLKLENYGIRGNAHKILKSCLAGHDQMIQKISSGSCKVEYDVSQGIPPFWLMIPTYLFVVALQV